MPTDRLLVAVVAVVARVRQRHHGIIRTGTPLVAVVGVAAGMTRDIYIQADPWLQWLEWLREKHRHLRTGRPLVAVVAVVARVTDIYVQGDPWLQWLQWLQWLRE